MQAAMKRMIVTAAAMTALGTTAQANEPLTRAEVIDLAAQLYVQERVCKTDLVENLVLADLPNVKLVNV
jgi:hypothetical protein